MQPPSLIDLTLYVASHIPQPWRAWFLFVLAVIVPVATLAVGRTPVKYKATWWGKALWWISGAVFVDERGSIKIPGTPWVLGVGSNPPPPAAP
jgi:hypothetical protein